MESVKPGIIYVDSRVGSKELADLLRRHRVTVELATLHSADFAFSCGHTKTNPFCEGDRGCKIGVERKTLGDLCSSLLKGRLAQQIPNLLDDYTMSWIVVEGTWRPGQDDSIEVPRRGGWVQARGVTLTYSQLSSWLVRYDVFGGGRLCRWRTGGDGETAAFVVSLYRWWQKEWDRHQTGNGTATMEKMQAPQRALMWRPTNLHKVALSLPEIGLKGAKKVGRYFGSIEEMIGASEEEWRKAGLGKVDSHTVYEAIRRRYR